MHIVLYEKPTCSKCREANALLESRGIPIERVNYYLDPLDRETLVDLLRAMGARPRDILRTGENLYEELGLAQREASDDELIDLLVRHPDLMQRPILRIDDRAVLGRPIEQMIAFLDATRGL